MDSAPLRKSIVLIGFMGSGKSSVGRIIAQRQAYRFCDTDQIVVQATGSQITDIFKSQGEEYFRDRETSALESLTGQKGLVIATGGGIILREANVALLRRLGFVVWLKADEEAIFNRVSRNNKRPLVQTADPRGTIRTLLAQRTPLYAAAAQFTVDTTGRSHEQVADAIILEAERAI